MKFYEIRFKDPTWHDREYYEVFDRSTKTYKPYTSDAHSLFHNFEEARLHCTDPFEWIEEIEIDEWPVRPEGDRLAEFVVCETARFGANSDPKNPMRALWEAATVYLKVYGQKGA